jgi:hypothetical protein
MANAFLMFFLAHNSLEFFSRQAGGLDARPVAHSMRQSERYNWGVVSGVGWALTEKGVINCSNF